MKKNKLKSVLALLVIIIGACSKEFLDKKPNKALVIPTKLVDLQALLDNSYNLLGQTHYLVHIADGEFEVSEAGLKPLDNVSRNSYLWNKDIFENNPSFDWNKLYNQVLYANIALEGLDQIKRESSNKSEFDMIYGTALFIRSYAFCQLLQQFADHYEEEIANSTPGIPLRLLSNINIQSKRETLEESYKQIIKDLNQSIEFLPEKTERKSRPSQAAAWALLARTYLIMGENEKAIDACSSALSIQNELIDYNELDTLSDVPFPDGWRIYNEEIIYYTEQLPTSFYDLASVTVASDLFKKYKDFDLRKKIFFTSGKTFKGSYGGSPYSIFTGLATNELYLIRSECYARIGKIKEAMDDLNILMKRRLNKSYHIKMIPYSASNETAALMIILEERRKELVARGLRWSDLRRLNKDPRFQITLERSYQGELYQLFPNDKRYTFPIPEDEIMRNGMEQNER